MLIKCSHCPLAESIQYKLLKLPEGRPAPRGTGGSGTLMDNVSALSLHPVLVLGRGEEGKPILPVSHGRHGHILGEPGGGLWKGDVDTGMGP